MTRRPDNGDSAEPAWSQPEDAPAWSQPEAAPAWQREEDYQHGDQTDGAWHTDQDSDTSHDRTVGRHDPAWNTESTPQHHHHHSTWQHPPATDPELGWPQNPQWNQQDPQWNQQDPQWRRLESAWDDEHGAVDEPATEQTLAIGQRGGRRHRFRRTVLLTVTGLVLLAVAGAVTVNVVSQRYLGDIKRIPDPFTALPEQERPAPTPEGLTILLAGIDSQAPSSTGAGADGEPDGRSDSLMVVRVTADRKRAYVVSIPRDSWVPIPGHGTFKINAAYAYGGPALAVQTVEELTNLRIDHFALIDLAGLRDLTDAVGGVTVTIPAETRDSSTSVSWQAGPQRLNGDQAVRYVRQRHGLPNGDLDRLRRHQNFLRALLTEVLDRDTLTSPGQLAALLGAVSQTVSVDEGLTNDKIRKLALDLRGIRDGVKFLTAPVTSSGYVGDQWVIWLDTDRGPEFWEAVRTDSLEQYIDRRGADQLDSVVR